MDKRGIITEGQNFLSGNFVYIFFWFILFVPLLIFVTGFRGEASWESLYAQQIVQIINTADSGANTNVTLDITKLIELAAKHNKPYDKIIFIDNVANKVTVSVRQDAATSFYYFNDVDIVNIDPKKLEKSTGQSKLYFDIRGKGK